MKSKENQLNLKKICELQLIWAPRPGPQGWLSDQFNKKSKNFDFLIQKSKIPIDICLDQFFQEK